MRYDNVPLEDCIGNHAVFKERHKVTTIDPSNNLFTEFRACLAMGLDPDFYFAKDKFMRMFIVGGYVADNAINNMRSYDSMKDKEAK